MKTEEDLIWESLVDSKKVNETYGCLMIYLNDKQLVEDVNQWCNENIQKDMYHEMNDKWDDGLHITCQYGFKDITINDITKFITAIIKEPIKIELDKISKFENGEYDVIKVDVNSPDLHKLSDNIRNQFKNQLEITFPDYHPHMTLAYVKKGKLKDINDIDMFKGKNYVFDQFVYNDGNDNKYDIL